MTGRGSIGTALLVDDSLDGFIDVFINTYKCLLSLLLSTGRSSNKDEQDITIAEHIFC